MSKTKIKPPKGWRVLKDGVTVLETDRVLPDCADDGEYGDIERIENWTKSAWVGKKIGGKLTSDCTYIRRIKKGKKK